MLIKGYNHHYREIQKKLFLGATWMVFATTPDPHAGAAHEEGEEAPSAGQAGPEGKAPKIEDFNNLPGKAREFYEKNSFFIDQVKNISPGKQGYKPADRAEIEMDWNDMMKEYNGLQGYVTYFGDFIKFIQAPDFNPQHPRWSGQFDSILATFENLTNDRNIHLSEKTRRALLKTRNDGVHVKKSVIEADLKDIQTSFIQMRADIMRRIEEGMVDDFKKQLTWLKG